MAVTERQRGGTTTAERVGPVCGRCEAVPGPLPEAGTLFLAPPLAHTGGTLRRVLTGRGLAPTNAGSGILAVELAAGDLGPLAAALRETLSARELADTRTLLLPPGASVTVADLMRAQSLGVLAATSGAVWLVDLLREKRLVTHLQPIVRTAAPGEVYGYECLMRGVAADGALVSPATMYAAASEADLQFQLDLAARLQAIRTVQEQGLSAHIFINFMPASVYDPVFCLRSTVRAVAAAGLDPERIVFEAVESEDVRDSGHLLNVLGYYRRAGFRVALDDLGAGYASLNLLTKLRPDLVKLDMELIRGVDRDPFKATLAAKLLEAAREWGIATVAEGVETEGEWRWLRDHGADFVQGYLFARPGNPAPIPVAPESAPR